MKDKNLKIYIQLLKRQIQLGWCRHFINCVNPVYSWIGSVASINYLMNPIQSWIMSVAAVSYQINPIQFWISFVILINYQTIQSTFGLVLLL
jgi:hypothetical protein